MTRRAFAPSFPYAILHDATTPPYPPDACQQLGVVMRSGASQGRG
jgi:hypothetical protein